MAEHPAAALVVGFDSRPESAGALAAAADLAGRLGAVLHVVHAVDFGDYPVDPEGADWEDGARTTLDAEREAVSAALAGRDLSWTFRAWRGDPTAALLRAAEEADALMIVVGTRGEGWRGALEHLLAPSVPHRIISRGHRPVLVVRHHDGSHPPPPAL